MALRIDDLEALKQIFKEQEENENSHKQTKKEIDKIQQEKIALEKRKQAHKEKLDFEKMKLLQEKEERAKEKERQQEKQLKNDNWIFIMSMIFAGLGAVIPFIVFLVVVLKF